MDEITVFPGIRGTRTLAAAFAVVTLRNRGLIKEGQSVVPKYNPRGRRPWRADELKTALALRGRRKSFGKIGAALGRSAASVQRKLYALAEAA